MASIARCCNARATPHAPPAMRSNPLSTAARAAQPLSFAAAAMGAEARGRPVGHGEPLPAVRGSGHSRAVENPLAGLERVGALAGTPASAESKAGAAGEPAGHGAAIPAAAQPYTGGGLALEVEVAVSAVPATVDMAQEVAL